MRHFHKGIPGWCSFNGLYTEVVKAIPARATQDGAALLVEVGTWKGRSAAFMGVEIINSGKNIQFVTVDHFKGSPNHGDDPDVAAGRLEAVARRNLEPVKSVVRILSMSSVEAAATFEDGSIDFLFLDGTHDYDNVFADLTAWLPKMRPGGLIAGDDANWRGVKEAARDVLGDIVVVQPHVDKTKGRYWRAAHPVGAQRQAIPAS